MKDIAKIILLALTAYQAEAVASDKCVCLAFSSGNQQVAYQAGVLKTLASKLPEAERSYTHVSGVGGGAVNAAILANFGQGLEDKAAAKMEDFWTKSGNASLWHNWPLGVAHGLMKKGGVYNNAATLDFIRDNLADVKPMQRWVDVGITDVLHGAYVEILQDYLQGENFFQTMFASFAQPFFFEPVKYNG